MCSKCKSAQNPQVHPLGGQGLSLALSRCEQPFGLGCRTCSHIVVHCPHGLLWYYTNSTGSGVIPCRFICTNRRMGILLCLTITGIMSHKTTTYWSTHSVKYYSITHFGFQSEVRLTLVHEVPHYCQATT